jgi:hypothetical protein
LRFLFLFLLAGCGTSETAMDASTEASGMDGAMMNEAAAEAGCGSIGLGQCNNNAAHVCDDMTLPVQCVGTKWTCADGGRFESDCWCQASDPHGPQCTCQQGTGSSKGKWVCPDAGSDAGTD